MQETMAKQDDKHIVNGEKEISEKYRKLVQRIALIGLFVSIGLCYWIMTGTYFKPEAEGGMFSVHLRQLGIFGPIVFIMVQIIQVVIPIIPGGIVSVSGNFVFGVIWGFIYNYIGLFIGSMIAFQLARRYGEFFVKCFVSDETYDKYIGWTYDGNRFAWILGILFFLPAAPDDILCMIAGLTKMKFRTFVWIFIPTKAVSTFTFTWLIQIGIEYFLRDIWPVITNMFS